MSETYGNLPVEIDPTAWFGRTFSPPVPLDISSIQEQISEQLNSFFQKGGIPIQSYIWPNQDLDTFWNGPNPAYILISYEATRLGKPLDTNTMLQERTLEFSIIILARQISWARAGTGSVFLLIDSVEAALSGFRPAGCRNGYFTEERFSERDPEGGIWLYVMTYEVTTMRPKLLPEYVLANLQKISHLIGDAGSNPVSMVISASGTLSFPADTLLYSVVTPNGSLALLGRDYNYSSSTGSFEIIPGGLLAPNMTVQVVTSPVIDTITAP